MPNRISIAIDGDTPADTAAIFHLLLNNPRLDEILAEIKKLGMDQKLVDQIFQQVSQNKGRLDDALAEGAEP